MTSCIRRPNGTELRRLPMAPEDLLEAAVLIYLQGLGLHAGNR